MLRAPEFNHSKLIKGKKKSIFKPTRSFSITNPILCTNKLICHVSFISLCLCIHHIPIFLHLLLRTHWPVKSVCSVWVGSLRSFCLAQRWALVIQVGGWREQVAQVGGSALILDHREASKNKEQCLWDEKQKRSNVFQNRASKITVNDTSLCLTKRLKSFSLFLILVSHQAN